MKTTTSFIVCLIASLITSGSYAQATSTCKVKTPPLAGTYEGGCAAGLASGIGRAAGTDHYEGTFRDGVPDGFGNWTRADGARAEGEFQNGKLNGLAKITESDGALLDGRFVEGRLTGIGTVTRKGAAPISVELRDGKIVPIQTRAGASAPGRTSSPIAASLELTLTCTQSPMPVELLKSVGTAGFIGKKPISVVDGIPTYKVTKPLPVFGFTVLAVSGYDPRVPHPPMPGTESPLLASAVVDADVPAVKDELNRRGITKALVSPAADSVPGHHVTEITCSEI